MPVTISSRFSAAEPASGRLRPTLLVFTLSPTGESGRRPLLPSGLRDAEVGLRRAWLDAALDAGRRNGCRLMVCSPEDPRLGPEVVHLPQRGASFGHRLANALDAALARSAGPVVMVGSDTPGLSPRHVREALTALRRGRVVVGPSPDGGLYLLATAEPVPGLGSRVRWCRRGTCSSLLRLLAARGRPHSLLEPLHDLDGAPDLERWLARVAARGGRWLAGLRPLLRRLAAWRRPAVPARLGRPRFEAVELPFVRGPPPDLALGS